MVVFEDCCTCLSFLLDFCLFSRMFGIAPPSLNTVGFSNLKKGKGGGATMRTAGIYQPPARFRATRACRELLTAVTWTRAAQAYIDNLKATGQCEDGVICGLDGTAWTGGLALSAEEGAAIGAAPFILLHLLLTQRKAPPVDTPQS